MQALTALGVAGELCLTSLELLREQLLVLWALADTVDRRVCTLRSAEGARVDAHGPRIGPVHSNEAVPATVLQRIAQLHTSTYAFQALFLLAFPVLS